MKDESSWEGVSRWYDKKVGDLGHYYQKNVIFPELLKLMHLDGEKANILDVGCGEGVFSRQLPTHVNYVGVDLSKKLIESARKKNHNQNAHFIVADATEPLKLAQAPFSHALAILSLQNMENGHLVFKQLRPLLTDDSQVIVVLNHPCFRIPRQSSWGIDESKKLQYRRMDRYMSELKIPITAHPGQKDSATTFSYHHPLSHYCRWLKEASFVLTDLQEWGSDKKSLGKNAKMENRARDEFPLFLSLIARPI